MRSRLNPQAVPKVTSASSVASSIAISGVPANPTQRCTAPSGRADCARAASSISSTGIRIVSSGDGQRRRARRGRRAGELLGHRARRGLDAAAGEAAEQRPGDDRDRQRDDQRVEQRAAGVGAEPLDRRERPGMRRHQSVRGRQTGDHRDARAAAAAGRSAAPCVNITGASSTRPTWKNTGSPMRKPESSSAQSSRRSPERRHQRAGHHRRAARFGEQLADHRAEADHHRDEAERVADALLERPRDVGERHPRREADDDRTGQQRDERREPHPGDEDHHAGRHQSAATVSR